MERKTNNAIFLRKMQRALELPDVQHAEAGVFNFVQIAAVRSQLLDRLSKHFFPKRVAKPRHDLRRKIGI
jgi:hypothetical protein